MKREYYRYSAIICETVCSVLIASIMHNAWWGGAIMTGFVAVEHWIKYITWKE